MTGSAQTPSEGARSENYVSGRIIGSFHGLVQVRLDTPVNVDYDRSGEPKPATVFWANYHYLLDSETRKFRTVPHQNSFIWVEEKIAGEAILRTMNHKVHLR